MRLLYFDTEGKPGLARGEEITEEFLTGIEGPYWLDIPMGNIVGVGLIESYFRFHPLTVEDALEPGTRTKIDFFDHYIFIVGYSAEPSDDAEGEYRFRDLGLYVSRDFLLTVRDPKLRFVDRFLEDIETSSEILKQGPDYILHYLLDLLVDGYFPILTSIERALDEAEEALFEGKTAGVSEIIYRQQHRLATLRRYLLPLRNVLSRLVHTENDLIDEEYVYSYRDVYDHAVRLAEMWETEKFAAVEAMETYRGLVNTRMNTIMKTLTIIATIMMPLTVITGIYGMNFANMPELYTAHGYFIVLGTMALIIVGSLLFFWRRGWFE
jgi:magnesium transporter